MTTDDLIRIFYSNSPRNIDRHNISEIAWMCQEGLIQVEHTIIASHQQFLKKLDFVEDPRNGLIRTGDTLAHMALKSLAADYLVSQKQIKPQDIRYEHNMIGFEVDVVDSDLYFPCECGDTNALKLEKYLGVQTVKVFTIIPYPHEGPIGAHSFQAGPRFQEYLALKQSHLSRKIHSLDRH